MKPKSNSVLERKDSGSNVLLPNALATRILDLELQLQAASVTKEQVLQLLGLYSEAMEFYEEHSDHKYKIFEQRIHNLLKKSNVNEVINGRVADNNTSRDRPIAEGRTHAERSAKQQAKAIIKFYNVEIEKQAARVQKDIEQQKQKILERVRSRSQSKGKVVNPESESATKEKLKPQLLREEPSKPMKMVFGNAFLDEITDFKLPQRRTIVKRQDS